MGKVQAAGQRALDHRPDDGPCSILQADFPILAIACIYLVHQTIYRELLACCIGHRYRVSMFFDELPDVILSRIVDYVGPVFLVDQPRHLCCLGKTWWCLASATLRRDFRITYDSLPRFYRWFKGGGTFTIPQWAKNGTRPIWVRIDVTREGNADRPLNDEFDDVLYSCMEDLVEDVTTASRLREEFSATRKPESLRIHAYTDDGFTHERPNYARRVYMGSSRLLSFNPSVRHLLVQLRQTRPPARKRLELDLQGERCFGWIYDRMSTRPHL